MKKLKAITKRVTSNSSNSYKPSGGRSTLRRQSSTQCIQVIRGGYNVDLNSVDDSFTEVHKICLLNRSEDSLFKLLKTGVNANVVDRVTGSTPLHLSVVGNNSAFIRILLSNGAQIDLKDGRGKTALMKAIEIENVEIARYLIYNKANANVPDESGDTAIFIALRNNSIDCIRLLVQDSVNVNFNILNKSHQLPLHLVANSSGLNEFLNRITEATVNIDIQDASKMTPLMLACACGNEDAVSLLLSRKADVGITDSQGRMAHEIAKANCHLQIASLVESYSEKTNEQRPAEQIKQAVLMNWTDSDDSSDDANLTRSLTPARKVSGAEEKKSNTTASSTGESSKRPSYGSVIEELNQLSHSQNNDNIQPSALRKTKVESNPKRTSQAPSMDLNLKKLEASFLSSNSDDNSIASRDSLDSPKKPSNVTSKDNPVFNDQFIQRLRDVLDDEIRDNDELDDLLMSGAVNNSTNPFAVASVDEKDKAGGETVDSPVTSEVSHQSSSPATTEREYRPAAVPALAPIRSLISNRNLDLQFTKATSSTTSLSPQIKSSNAASTLDKQNHLDYDSPPSSPKVVAMQSKESLTRHPESASESLIAFDKVKQLNVAESSKSDRKQSEMIWKDGNTSSHDAINDHGPSTGRDSTLSSRETFDLNVRLKETQAAYESERISRINLETELELLKKNCDSFIHDFHTALREKLEFESKLYRAESENSKLHYELERATGARDDLIREIDAMRESQKEAEKRICALKIENERLINEKASFEEQINLLKDNLVKSESTNVDDNENEKRMHQVVLENITLLNELSSVKEQNLLLKNDSIKCQSQMQTELAIRDNELKRLSAEKEMLVRENEMLKEKYNEMHRVTKNSFANEMGELKVTIEQLTGKMNSSSSSGNYNVDIDGKVQRALEETRGTLAELTRQICAVRDASGSDGQGIASDPVDDRLHALQRSIGLLEDRMIAQEIRSSNSHTADGENESKLIYPQIIDSIPVGRVPQSAFVRALLQSQDESHLKLIKEITSIRKDLGLFCWSVEQS